MLNGTVVTGTVVTEPVAGWWPTGATIGVAVLAGLAVLAAIVANRSSGTRRSGWIVLAVALLVGPPIALCIGRMGERTIHAAAGADVEVADRAAAPDTVTIRCAAFAEPGDAGTVAGIAVTSACRDASATTRAASMLILAATLATATVGLLLGTGQLGPGARPPRRPEPEQPEQGQPGPVNL